MPGLDRTGPSGEGPRTGRGAGRCGKAGVSGLGNRCLSGVFGRGRAQGGGGHRRRHLFHATGITGWQRAAAGEDGPAAGQTAGDDLTAQEELELLCQQADSVTETLEQIRRRIDQIQGSES